MLKRLSLCLEFREKWADIRENISDMNTCVLVLMLSTNCNAITLPICNELFELIDCLIFIESHFNLLHIGWLACQA